jgi:hypothetical protein
MAATRCVSREFPGPYLGRGKGTYQRLVLLLETSSRMEYRRVSRTRQEVINEVTNGGLIREARRRDTTELMNLQARKT